MKLFGIIFAVIAFLLHPMQPVFAVCESFTLLDANGATISDLSAVDNEKTLTISFNLSDSKPADYQTNGWFKVYLSPGPDSDKITPTNNKLSYVVNGGVLEPGKNYSVELRYDEPGENDRPICTEVFATKSTSSICHITVSPSAPSSIETITTTVDMNTEETGYDLYYDPTGGIKRYPIKKNVGDGYSTQITNHGIGNATLFIAKAAMLSKRLCERSFIVTEQGGNALEAQFTDLCSFAEGKAREDCTKCTGEEQGIWTAIGCIPSTPGGFVGKILPFAMGLGGGIAFLLMLFGALQIMTSAGNPEKLNAGKELVTSAIVGLLLIIFSVFLLKLIGADILGVPGFK